VDNLLPDVGALVIQINSSEFSLYMTVYSSMAVINLLDATEDASAHSFGRNIAKEPMTMFSHEIEVGVKRTSMRGCLARQCCTLWCLWVA
jgi:hypothetical protein